MYRNSRGQSVALGKELGKGGAATVYLHAADTSKAIKIFKPEYLVKENTLPKRLEQLYKLSQAAQLDINYGNLTRAVGSWPKDIVKDLYGNVVGFSMDTVKNGIDLTEIIFARDVKSAFYKHRLKPNYSKWKETFLYHPNGIRNRFILSYYLAISFERIYQLKTRDGKTLDLELCNFDIKPNNILVSLETIGGKSNIVPYILDLDNLTLKNKTGTLAPNHPQFTPEYKAPEGPIDKFYDYYSIAVIFYQLIFNIHPFHGVTGGARFTDGTEMDFFVRNKCFPWGRNRKFLSKMTQDDLLHGNFQKISPELQTLFLRAFDSDSPKLRPSMQEWSKAFVNFLSDRSVSFNRMFSFPT